MNMRVYGEDSADLNTRRTARVQTQDGFAPT